jgi:uncharacterized protein with PIN domain
VASFKFQIDQSVSHLARLFPKKRVATNQSLGISENASDEELVEIASFQRNLIITANRGDFEHAIKKYVARSSKKQFGCKRVPGLVLLLSNDKLAQERMLKGLESRLFLDGKKITFKHVHELDLLVRVHSTGKAVVTRLPRCPHCPYEDENTTRKRKRS